MPSTEEASYWLRYAIFDQMTGDYSGSRLFLDHKEAIAEARRKPHAVEVYAVKVFPKNQVARDRRLWSTPE